MPKQEVYLPEGKAVINASSTGGSIKIGEFKATLFQLKALSAWSRGLSWSEASRETGASKTQCANELNKLIDANTDDFSEDEPPTLNELGSIAKEHELLNPYVIRGLEIEIEGLRSKKTKSPL